MLPFRPCYGFPRLSRATAHVCTKAPIFLYTSRINVPSMHSFSTSPPLYAKQVIVKAPQLFTYDGSHGVMREFSAKVGDRVAKGQEIGDIETIKMFYEIESPGTGILSQLLVSSGDEIRSFQDVAVLELDDPEHKIEEPEKQN